MPSAETRSYLPWSIFNLTCCFFPLGIAAIIYSCRVQSAIDLGNSERAKRASSIAKNLNIAATVIGIIAIIIIVVIYFTIKK
ncbi:dispanin subfamily A member 2b-like [Scyliorhinus torazame]|uniref:Uncharacterized protein n=1 Tax=Scyliorhinus torazame TaxID=75743 RepID=A0A401NQA4_SCYTO|nr:hypothetical protein [Scyliorhinus torazame]